MDFDCASECIAEGRAATRQKADEIEAIARAI
jgi:hypothetical protein